MSDRERAACIAAKIHDEQLGAVASRDLIAAELAAFRAECEESQRKMLEQTANGYEKEGNAFGQYLGPSRESTALRRIVDAVRAEALEPLFKLADYAEREYWRIRQWADKSVYTLGVNGKVEPWMRGDDGLSYPLLKLAAAIRALKGDGNA